MPDEFTGEDYLAETADYDICGGAIVSGSFQAFDQSYLIDALRQLGEGFVGVTQFPADTSDEEIVQLHEAGVRAVRFNLKRGGSEEIQHLSNMAHRVHDLVDWHVELYVDSKELAGLYEALIALPAVSIDHLGLSKEGLPVLTKLVERGVRVKATGFGRVDFDVSMVLKQLYTANPQALMFGTDMPSTRAPRPYRNDDFLTVIDTLGEEAVNNVFSRNALAFYKVV